MPVIPIPGKDRDAVIIKSAGGYVTLADIKQQGNDKPKPIKNDNSKIQLRNVKQAKVDIRQANSEDNRHSVRAQVDNSSPPLPPLPRQIPGQTSKIKSNTARTLFPPLKPFVRSTAPVRRQRLLENDRKLRELRRARIPGRTRPEVTTSRRIGKSSGAAEGPNGIGKLKDRIKEAARIIKDNYNAGVEAASLEPRSHQPARRRLPDERERQDRNGKTRREVNAGVTIPIPPHTRMTPRKSSQHERRSRNSQSGETIRVMLDQSGDAREAVRAKLAEVDLESRDHNTRNTSDTHCAICRRSGAVLYKEASSKPLCEGCLSLGFTADRISLQSSQMYTSQATIPAPLKINKNQTKPQAKPQTKAEDRCTRFPTQEELAAGTWGISNEPPPSARFPTRTVSRAGTTNPLPPKLLPKTRALYDPPLLNQHAAPCKYKPSTPAAKRYTSRLPPLQQQSHHPSPPPTPSIPLRPTLQVTTTFPIRSDSRKEDYKPAAWRTAGKQKVFITPSGPVPAASAAQPTLPSVKSKSKTKSHRTTVQSIWDDDVPEGGYAEGDVPPVPALPRLPFATPVAVAASQVKDERKKGRQAYCSSVYSEYELEPEPEVRLGFHAVPEGRYENF